MNPIHRLPFEEDGLKPLKTLKSGNYTEALIYALNQAAS
jgi:hypothetical protein